MKLFSSLLVPLGFYSSCIIASLNEVSKVANSCIIIQDAVSSRTTVSYPGSPLYVKDNFHWLSSSNEDSICSVEPGTPEDLSEIISILGSTQTPFNVKGSGHGGNPGQASTTGVQIAMYQFSEVTYHSNNNTADIGTGLTWDTVYLELSKFNQTVTGGRLPTVGVAGFVLGGGGYSWLSNQHGLTIDTVVSFDLVLPNGTFAHASPSSHPDLFFALKGGYNNFGIVYRITLKTYYQGPIWGGLLVYTEDQIPALTAAFADFAANNTDPKAESVAIYSWESQIGLGIYLGIFYDAPTPPPGIFDEILSIPAASSNVAQSRRFYDFVQSLNSNVTDFYAPTPRGLWEAVSVLSWTPSLLTQIANQTKFYWKMAEKHGLTSLQWSVDHFLPSYASHSQGGAYPHDPSLPLLPMAITWEYQSSSEDDILHDSIRESADFIVNQAVAEGQQVGGRNQIRYPNYATYGTPLSELYGDNVPRLQRIKKAYDPHNIMGLAGGFKI